MIDSKKHLDEIAKIVERMYGHSAVKITEQMYEHSVLKLAEHIDITQQMMPDKTLMNYLKGMEMPRSLLDNSSFNYSLIEKAHKLNITEYQLWQSLPSTQVSKDMERNSQILLDSINNLDFSSLISRYNISNNLYANSIASQIVALKGNEKLHIEDPDADDIDQVHAENLELEKDEKIALITVDHLPLKIISKILKNPREVRNVTPRQFEELIADLLNELGFQNIVLTPRSRDGGKDIIASHSIQGIPLTFYFECKRYAEGNKIQLETMRSLLGTMAHESRKVNKGILVTTSTFTKGCKEFILSESRLDGKDYNDILGWIAEVKARKSIN